jgi:molybdopterin-guanine dinucleotide biosynthesis protein A
VEACARSGRRSLRGLLERLDVTIVPLRDLADLDPELRFLCNVNTPADLDEARRLEEMVT